MVMFTWDHTTMSTRPTLRKYFSFLVNKQCNCNWWCCCGKKRERKKKKINSNKWLIYLIIYYCLLSIDLRLHTIIPASLSLLSSISSVFFLFFVVLWLSFLSTFSLFSLDLCLPLHFWLLLIYLIFERNLRFFMYCVFFFFIILHFLPSFYCLPLVFNAILFDL